MAKKIPCIKTERLVLRNITVEDAYEIVRWRSDSEVYKYFLSPHIITLEEHLNWFNKIYLFNENRYDWMAVDSAKNLIGVFGISRDNKKSENAEINYILAPEYRGYGYAGEAVKALLDYARDDWNCKSVMAEIHEDNKESIKFASKLGMILSSKKEHFLVYKIHLQDNDSIRNKIFIRVDGNSSIGTGHVMRCLAIADQIQSYDYEAIFITADETVIEMIQDRGFKCICINSTWNDLEQEVDKVCSLIKERKIKLLLIDSYFVTEDYLKKIKACTKVFYIDDLNVMTYPVNSLINYNVYGEDLGYDKNAYDNLYLGPLYTPLRNEFISNPKRSFKGIKSILITSGGTDEYNAIGAILSSLLENEDFSSLTLYCVLGVFNKNIDVLKKQYENNHNIHFLVNISNISFYMKTCDIAITAGGSTCYELCACGIPSIVYVIADNQFGVARAFSQKGIIPYVGDIREDIKLCMRNMVDEIRKLKDKDYWNNQSIKMQKIVDGKGANRIAQLLIDSVNL